jgi:hypothetical protein
MTTIRQNGSQSRRIEPNSGPTRPRKTTHHIPEGLKMRKLIAGALALATLLCAPVLAQADPNVGLAIAAPAAFLPAQGIYCPDGNGKALPCNFGSGGGGAGGTVAQGASSATNDPWQFDLRKVGGSTIALGRQASATSLPVVLASDGQGSSASAPLFFTGNATAGNAAPGNGAMLYGLDSSNLAHPLHTDGNGYLQVVRGGDLTPTVTGNVAAGQTDAGNPIKIGCYVSTANPTAYGDGYRQNVRCGSTGSVATFLTDVNGNSVLGSTAADATANPNGYNTRSFGFTFNGTSWDRQRDANTTNGTTGTGLLGAGVLGKFNATLPSYSDGQFGNIQLDSYGNLRTRVVGYGFTGADAVGNSLVSFTNANTSNGASPYLMPMAGFVFNGTNWDRVRGDTTGGQYVQERERSQFFTETFNATAASTTYVGAVRDLGASNLVQWSTYRCFFRPSDQSLAYAGVQVSADNSNWAPTAFVSGAAASNSTIVPSPIFARYVRCYITTNSTAAPTSLVSYSAFGAN